MKRTGKKKAVVAIGHSILISVYHVLHDRVSYQDLGRDYFERRNVSTQRQRLIRQLESLAVSGFATAVAGGVLVRERSRCRPRA
jgi:ABC-type enterobactin transport system permease subunit